MSTKIKYKGETVTSIEGGQTATLHLTNKKLTDDLVIEAGGMATPTAEEQTVTPTKKVQEIVPMDADYLSKVTVNAIPSEYEIPTYFNVETDIVLGESEKTVTITLIGSTTSGGLEECFVKFGSGTVDNGREYDYFVPAMFDGTNASDGNDNIKTRTLTIPNKAYIWGYKYQLNDSGILTAGTTYEEATEITLSDGDTLTLYSGNAD